MIQITIFMSFFEHLIQCSKYLRVINDLQKKNRQIEKWVISLKTDSRIKPKKGKHINKIFHRYSFFFQNAQVCLSHFLRRRSCPPSFLERLLVWVELVAGKKGSSCAPLLFTELDSLRGSCSCTTKKIKTSNFGTQQQQQKKPLLPQAIRRKSPIREENDD